MILEQNYFSYDNEYFMQEDFMLAMGSPLLGVLADKYLNYFENKFLTSTCNKQ